MKKDWSDIVWLALLPLLAVVVLYATEIVWRNAFFLCAGGNCRESIPEHLWEVVTLDPEPKIETTQLKALQYSGRLTWYVLGEMYFFVCIIAVIIAAVLTYPQIPRHPLIWTLVALALSFLVGWFLYANPQVHMKVFLVILDQTIRQEVAAIIPMTNFFNSLGNAAAFALLLASCATLLPAQVAPYPQGMRPLSQKMKALQVILYTGTLLLVGTMLLKKAVFQWALAYTSQEEAALEAARMLVANLLMMDGAFYTLVLAAAYFPAALILQRRANRLLDPATEGAEREKKLKEFGLTLTWAQSFPRILAILGPMLVGPVGELLKAVMN